MCADQRLFKSNWRTVQLILYSNASFIIVKPKKESSVIITCEKKSTLIIFGQQLNIVPKRPEPPSCFKLEQMFGIGLISHIFESSGRLKRTKIIFYWFCLPTNKELIEWIFVFQNVLSIQSIKSNTINLSNQPNRHLLNKKIDNIINNQKIDHLDDISMGMLVANTTTYNNRLTPGILALGGAGVLTKQQFASIDNSIQFLPNVQNFQQSFILKNEINLNNDENSQINNTLYINEHLLNQGGQLTNLNYSEYLNNSNDINLNNSLIAPNCVMSDFDINNSLDCFEIGPDFSTIAII